MSHSLHRSVAMNCAGRWAVSGRQSAQAFLKAGLAGFASVSLPGILRLRAQNPLLANDAAKSSREKTAVIMVWQRRVVCRTSICTTPNPTRAASTAVRSNSFPPALPECNSQSCFLGRRPSRTSSPCCGPCVRPQEGIRLVRCNCFRAIRTRATNRSRVIPTG